MKLKKIDLTFDEAAHVYTLNGNMLAGVTTILRVMDNPAINQWKVNQAVAYIDYGYREGSMPMNAILKEAKTAHRRKSTDATDVGTEVHDAIKAFLKGNEPAPDHPFSPQAQKAMAQFFKWFKVADIQIEHVEMPVASEEHRFAGTPDLVCMFAGKRTVVDFKTSSGIYPNYYLQLAAYQMALEEISEKQPTQEMTWRGDRMFADIPMDPIHQRMIVRIPKDGAPYEERVVPTDYAFDCKTFLGLLQLSKWQKHILTMEREDKDGRH